MQLADIQPDLILAFLDTIGSTVDTTLFVVAI
jgi:hypothetical protein